MNPLQRVLAKLSGAKLSGKGWSACCPAHKDRHPSLSVTEGRDGRALLKCHAGCSLAAILAALGMAKRDLYLPKSPDETSKRRRSGAVDRVFATSDEAIAELEKTLGTRSQDWTYEDENGVSVCVVVRWERPDGGKEFRPVARHAGGWRISAMPEPRPLYRLPDVRKANRVVLAEGEKCCEAFRSIGFTATTTAGGAQASDKTDVGPLAGKELLIFPDNDAPGRRWAAALAERLVRLSPAAVVRIVELPGLPTKGDIAEWIDNHGDAAEPDGMRAEIELLAAGVTPFVAASDPQADAAACEVIVGKDEYRVNAEAIAALAERSDLYQRGGMLVRVVEQEPSNDPKARIRRQDKEPIIREVTLANLRETLTRHVLFQRETPDGMMPMHPPPWCVRAIHERGQWPGVRCLESVVSHPILLPDGSLLAANGYDAASELLVCIPAGLVVDVPPSPTLDDVRNAVAVLDDILTDFPFEKSAHRAAWYAALLTPLAWFAFDGPAPLFLIDANTRGAGKGLLVDSAAVILTGRRFPVMSYTHDREELRKRITTSAVEGDRMVMLDNLAGTVGNDILDSALTSATWKDRLLGVNRRFEGPLNVTWFATGNNVELRADTSRRVCHIRLESPEERPELKSGFRYPKLLNHVRENRGKLLTAALTILRGWVVAGRPMHNLPAWGSFEGWSGMVREAVVFAGLTDPGETREELQTLADRDAAAMRTILGLFPNLDPENQGITTAEIIQRFKDNNPPSWVNDLRSAVEELTGKLDARSLGFKFRHFKRRNFGGWFLDAASGRSANRWFRRPASAGRGPMPTHPPQDS